MTQAITIQKWFKISQLKTSHPHEVSPYFPAFLQGKTSQNSCLYLLSPLLYQSHNFFNLIESGSLSFELIHQVTVLLLLGPSVNTFNRVDHFLLLKAHCSLAFMKPHSLTSLTFLCLPPHPQSIVSGSDPLLASFF